VQLVRVPDEVEVVAGNEEDVGRDALQVQELLVARDGGAQELAAPVVRQRHLYTHAQSDGHG